MKRINSHSNLRFFLISILFLFIFIQCDEDEIPFPHVSVYAILALDTQLENVLPGNYVEIIGHGLGGLIIYRVSNSNFLAFDKACTYEASKSCILTDDSEMYECPCCESRFWMVNNEDIAGSVYQGPASYPLKQYKCFFDGTNTVTVTN
jgi:hypothetical protein